MLGLFRSMSQPSLVHLAQMVALAPLGTYIARFTLVRC